MSADVVVGAALVAAPLLVALVAAVVHALRGRS